VDFDDVLAAVQGWSTDEKEKQYKAALQISGTGWKFDPRNKPQTDAYFSEADITLYGGQAGGGKTDLLLGLAFTSHQRSLIMRRSYTDLGALIERAVEINGSRDGLNRSPPPKFRTANDRVIDFGAATHVGSEQAWQGQPHDFIGFDEVVQFQEVQVRFLMGWNRTTVPGQRCRIVMASNPPVMAQGDWIVGYFRPWLDPTHPNPAKPGDLRWFVTGPDGKDMEVEGPMPFDIDGDTYIPLSRTFIPATVKDNPYLADTNYQAQLDALQEPLRSAVRDGNFMAARADQAMQVIPSDWIREAMRRGANSPTPPPGVPMTAVGVDVAISLDETVIAPRYDYWYAPLVVVPGAQTPTYSQGAALIVQHRRNEAAVVVDVGGGYGGGVVTCLAENGIQAHKFNGATAGWGRTKDNSLGFCNKRAEAWWRFREALDPDQEFGSPVMLPDDPILAADLGAPTFEVKTRGIQIEEKDKIKERLGRSPDRGDAVVMAWSEGTNALLGKFVGDPKAKQTRAIMGPRKRRD
jgi:hypothetical protein